MMDLLGVLIGFVLSQVATISGVLIHMRYLDRKLLPSPAKPAVPPKEREP